MQVRTQLAVVAVIAAGWSAGNATSVRPAVPEARGAERLDMTSLENVVARDNDNVRAARDLSSLYLERGLLSLVIQTMGRMTPAVQRDARVALNVARALERLGDVQSAAARVDGAINRCGAVAPELAQAHGCDATTQTELAIESEALRLMIEWRITPVSDPERAALAHERAVRPIRLAPMAL